MMSSNNGNKKKNEQLGISYGAACNRLRKNVLFYLLSKYGENICYRCQEYITSPDELSMEHKIPWLNSANPVDLFFDLENIAFSHLGCNISDARKYNKGIYANKHGTTTSYRRKCRCKECRGARHDYYKKTGK